MGQAELVALRTKAFGEAPVPPDAEATRRCLAAPTSEVNEAIADSFVWQYAIPDAHSEASSIVGAPALNPPLLAVDQAPVGVQLLGRWHGDESLTALGRWLAKAHVSKPA